MIPTESPEGSGVDTASDVTKTNIERFSTDDEVSHYEQLIETGLFEAERTLIDRYYTPGESVLDVGCGVGRTTVKLDELGFEVLGVDASRPQIERARELFPAIEFRVDNALDLDVADRSYDHVLFSYNGIDCIHPESSRLAALEEFRRVLKPNGSLAFSSRNAWYRFPALVLDRAFLSRFYLSAENVRRFFHPYKVQYDDAGQPFEMYLSTPRRQCRQLRQCGFNPLEIVGKRDGVARLFEIMPYYIAAPR